MKIFLYLFALITALPGLAGADNFTATPGTCFTGYFQTSDAFVEHIRTNHVKKGRGELTAGMVARIEADYRSWQAMDRNEVRCEFFTYPVDGIPVSGFVLRPRNLAVADLTPLIFNRGGNADLVISTKYLFNKLAPLSKKGFLVIGSFYRGARINGVPSPYRLEDEFGGRDVRDVLALLPIIDTFEGMRAKKVGVWGVSRGGMMAFLAARHTDRFATIIADSSPLDIIAEAESTERMESVFNTWIPAYAENKTAALRARSVVYWHDELDPIPILLLQGTEDSRVLPSTTLKFALQLQQAGHPYELIMFEGTGHGLRGQEARVEELVANWLRRHSSAHTPIAHTSATD